MRGFIPDFPHDGVVTVNRVVLKDGCSVDDLQERVAMLCEHVKTYHSDTGFMPASLSAAGNCRRVRPRVSPAPGASHSAT